MSSQAEEMIERSITIAVDAIEAENEHRLEQALELVFGLAALQREEQGQDA